MKVCDSPQRLDAGLPCAWCWLQLSAGTRLSPCGCSHRPPSVASCDLRHTCPSSHQPEEVNITQSMSNSAINEFGEISKCEILQQTVCILKRELKVLLQSYLYKHVADVFVSSLRCSVERGAFVLRFHLKVWVDAIHWKVKRRRPFY